MPGLVQVEGRTQAQVRGMFSKLLQPPGPLMGLREGKAKGSQVLRGDSTFRAVSPVPSLYKWGDCGLGGARKATWRVRVASASWLRAASATRSHQVPVPTGESCTLPGVSWLSLRTTLRSQAKQKGEKSLLWTQK